jgi:hypothetical protein
MRIFRFVLAFALLFSALTVFASPTGIAGADDISGKWSLAVDAPGETVDVLLDLKQKDESVTGTMASSHASGTIEKGTYKEKKFTATVKADMQGSPVELVIDGKVDGEKMTGSITAPGLGTFPFTGGKSK